MAQVDTIVVGQGLAGSILAWMLMQRGQRVVVVDAAVHPSASRCAAGIVNPMSGQRLVKAPGFDTHWHVAARCYSDLALQFGKPFWTEMPLLRVLRSAQELELLQRRRADPDYAAHISAVLATGASSLPIDDPFGSVVLSHAGYLNTNAVLDALRQHFKTHESLVEAVLDYEHLKPNGTDGWDWHGIAASQIVFCEGYGVATNPWFQTLPLQPVAGEILTLETSAELPREIINKGHWLLPLGERTCRVGATYAWGWEQLTPTSRAREELLGAVTGLWRGDLRPRVVAQCVGARVGTTDKAPLLGRHPKRPALLVFNGFGSKGAATIPYFAQRMVQHMLAGEPLPPEADISRCAAL